MCLWNNQQRGGAMAICSNGVHCCIAMRHKLGFFYIVQVAVYVRSLVSTSLSQLDINVLSLSRFSHGRGLWRVRNGCMALLCAQRLASHDECCSREWPQNSCCFLCAPESHHLEVMKRFNIVNEFSTKSCLPVVLVTIRDDVFRRTWDPPLRGLGR